MAVQNYRRLGHVHDEFPHVQRRSRRGEARRNNRRQTSRLVKRWEERVWKRELLETTP
ncbi:hypothetical protein SMD44_p10028 (plasmid) [Streptomyces alboflavus]|uniref:Uncharacterized protein n=1 Tax=Streptomyces alboflavus TaxID=67267 RepID=A0A291W3M9_9ACTN|nr:hypothetical protein [Streptomyces alboflavus]ATM24527.1 hypothetical protein SMD44_p10028 [Streptomyces alboflavus]